MEKAKEELNFFQECIVFAENYEETTLQQQVTNRYAITDNIILGVAQLNAECQKEGCCRFNRPTCRKSFVPIPLILYIK